jgi:predicted hydrocarbon binding protein/KaiC/GvpD/RAD55 family RecA-like ATPase
MILLVGPPGSGKTTFCEQTILQNLAIDKPIIYVTTEYNPSKAEASLRKKGLGRIEPDLLSFVDAYNETVGVSVSDRPDTTHADCNDLSSMDIAISKLTNRLGKEGVLLVFDSLTSPYLFNGSEILRFMKQTLSRFAAKGNSVLACMDEGCGKQEDLVAMMSTADGIIKIELMDGSKTFNVIKHPEVEPLRIEVPKTWSHTIPHHFDMDMWMQHIEMTMGLGAESTLRTEVGDYVNLFWPNLARWSCMLWDPKRFPTMTYDMNKQSESNMKEFFNRLPWRVKLKFKLFLPNNFSKVKDMKKPMTFMNRRSEGDRNDIMEYLEDASKTDEHYVRGYEGMACWGFENVGSTLRLGILGMVAGVLRGFEKDRGGPDRDWNIIETKCVGRGDPYCEMKMVPGEIDGLRESLESVDSEIVERIYDRLMDHLMAFLLQKKPLWERPRLGSEVSLHMFTHMIGQGAAHASDRYRMAIRLGGVMGGKRVGERLMEAGIREDEAVKQILHLLEHCKVGKVSIGDTIRIVQNCESFAMQSEEPSCFFTTGFLNGFFSAVKNQHVKETRCIAMGDPYCEWEFR